MIENNINKAFFSVFNQRHLPRPLLNIEKKCLHQLIAKWLLIEKQREPFEVIAHEQKQQAALGKLNIRMRIDRIDRARNHYLLIDYKSGKTNVNVNAWFGDRPDDPQLPLYAINITDVPVSTIAFAQIHPDQIGFKSISEYKNCIINDKTLEELKRQDIEKNWQKQFKQWKTTLEKLADDFCNGNATVDPKDYNKTCKHCHLKTLCRIQLK